MNRTRALQRIEEHVVAYIDDATGIVWVENGKTGMGHSAHPNIDQTGSIPGMRSRYPSWRNVRIVLSHGWYYNIDVLAVNPEDPYDVFAAQHCQCGGEHGAYQQVEPGHDIEAFTDPPVDPAAFEYKGRIYIRPLGRGIVLQEGEYAGWDLADAITKTAFRGTFTDSGDVHVHIVVRRQDD